VNALAQVGSLAALRASQQADEEPAPPSGERERISRRSLPAPAPGHLQPRTCQLGPDRSDRATWGTSASYAAFSAAGYSMWTLFQIWSRHDSTCLE
jgi:hypothetical protein